MSDGGSIVECMFDTATPDVLVGVIEETLRAESMQIARRLSAMAEPASLPSSRVALMVVR